MLSPAFADDVLADNPTAIVETGWFSVTEADALALSDVLSAAMPVIVAVLVTGPGKSPETTVRATLTVMFSPVLMLVAGRLIVPNLSSVSTSELTVVLHVLVIT